MQIAPQRAPTQAPKRDIHTDLLMRPSGRLRKPRGCYLNAILRMAIDGGEKLCVRFARWLEDFVIEVAVRRGIPKIGAMFCNCLWLDEVKDNGFVLVTPAACDVSQSSKPLGSARMRWFFLCKLT